MRGSAHNFDDIISEIFYILGNGPRMGEFDYGPYKSYSLYNKSNTKFHSST